MGLVVAKLELKYVHRTTDRHGNVYHYFRKIGCPRTRLPGMVGSEEFNKAYATCMGNLAELENPHKVRAGSMTALVWAWYSSAGFLQLAESTQKKLSPRSRWLLQ